MSTINNLELFGMTNALKKLTSLSANYILLVDENAEGNCYSTGFAGTSSPITMSNIEIAAKAVYQYNHYNCRLIIVDQAFIGNDGNGGNHCHLVPRHEVIIGLIRQLDPTIPVGVYDCKTKTIMNYSV